MTANQSVDVGVGMPDHVTLIVPPCPTLVGVTDTTVCARAVVDHSSANTTASMTDMRPIEAASRARTRRATEREQARERDESAVIGNP
jgi:hypothetical protein